MNVKVAITHLERAHQHLADAKTLRDEADALERSAAEIIWSHTQDLHEAVELKTAEKAKRKPIVTRRPPPPPRRSSIDPAAIKRLMATDDITYIQARQRLYGRLPRP